VPNLRLSGFDDSAIAEGLAIPPRPPNVVVVSRDEVATEFLAALLRVPCGFTETLSLGYRQPPTVAPI